MRNLGFIGTGLMGRPITGVLLEAGFQLTVWNRTRQKAEETLAKGAKWADTPAQVAAQSDLVITMVTDSAASEEVICGPGGVLEGAHEGLILVDMASIKPEMSRSIARRAAEKQVPMLDAPVTGAPKVAAAGKLGIMVGGPADVFEKVRPVFEALAAKIVHVGDNGMGVTLKLINNLVMAVAIEASAEALVLAAKAGIEPKKVMEITSVGGARTGAMETRGPWMLEHKFDAHFSADNMYKDLTTAMKLADECGASLPAASASLEILRAVRSRGGGGLDSCAVLTVLEAMAGI